MWFVVWVVVRYCRDYIGAFAVTIHGAEAAAARFEADHDDYSKIMVHALADRYVDRVPLHANVALLTLLMTRCCLVAVSCTGWRRRLQRRCTWTCVASTGATPRERSWMPLTCIRHVNRCCDRALS